MAVTITIERDTIKIVNDSGKVQIVQLEGDEPGDEANVESMLPYGFSSVPPEGAEAIFARVGDSNAQRVVLTFQHRDYRPKDLQPGEVILHLLGDPKVFLKSDGTIHIGSRAATDAPALASKVDAELAKIASALTTVAAGGGSLTGANSYTSPVATASARMKIDS